MKKVLLTSAYELFLNKNSNFMRNKGFELFTTSSGATALKLHEKHHFDLIIADIQLEDMRGCTLCSNVRKLERLQHTPIVVICLNLASYLERAMQSGASAVLFRPIDRIKFLEIIGSYIDLPIVRSKRAMLHVDVLSKKSDFKSFDFSHDISSTGILLESAYQLSLGDRISCQFVLPESVHVEVDGEVMRSVPTQQYKYNYGVKFVNLSTFSHIAIDNYVNASANLNR